jgi:AraC-like DNA-binding protein
VTEFIAKKEVFRLTSNIAPGVPLGLRSCGCYRLLPPWRGREKIERNLYQFHWCFAGRGLAVIDGEQYILGPGSVFLYLPGDKHIIRAGNTFLDYWWLTFDGPAVESIFSAFDFGREVYDAGECPGEIFLQLSSQIKDTGNSGQRRASADSYTLLAIAKGGHEKANFPEAMASKASSVINSRYMDSSLNINSIAAELAINRSQLSRIFRKKMNMTLIDYLTSLRINKAMAMLRTTGERISEIAAKTGYDNPDYFSKCFRKKTGMSPSEYRGGNK